MNIKRIGWIEARIWRNNLWTSGIGICVCHDEKQKGQSFERSFDTTKGSILIERKAKKKHCICGVSLLH